MFEYIEKINKDRRIELIKPFLKEKKAYIVGGFIRDLFFDKYSCDIDLIVCDDDINSFARNMADKLNAHFIELDKTNDIYRLMFEDKINYIDITRPVDNNLDTDIFRRDLTINATAYDINEEKFIDPAGGIEDIKKGIIRGISKKNFEDDPLRLLRVFRFYANTGFSIDPSLVATVKKLAPRIQEPAKERITAELLKMFEGKYCDLALSELDKCDLIEEILPIFKEIKKIPPNSHHHLDLFHHSIETVRQIQIIYENSPDEVKKYLNEKKYGGVKSLAFLKLAGFLHDAGKPATRTTEENTGRERFIGHDSVGAKIVEPILKNLKFSKKQIEYVKNLIKFHIYPSSMVSAPDVTEKAFLKFFRKAEGFVIDVIILAQADRLSARGEAITEEIVNKNISDLNSLLNKYFEIQKDLKPLEKLLDGTEIIKILNIKQGPYLGEIIKELYEAQISQEVTTKEDAVNFIRNKYSNGIKS